MSHHHVFASSPRRGDVHPDLPLQVTLVARRNPDGDHAKHAAAAGRARFGRRPHWTGAAFARTFGAHPQDLVRIAEAAEGHGFVVRAIDARTRLVTLRGTARCVREAFDVDLGLYEVDGHSRRGHSSPARVRNRRLAPCVEAVLGLDTLPVVRGPWVGRGAAATAVTYTARELMDYYRFPSATGRGEIIGLLQMPGGFDTGDVTDYFARAGMRRPRPVTHGRNQPAAPDATRHLVTWMNGAASHVPSDDESRTRWTFETTMDVELAGVCAPGAALRVWFAEQDDESGAVRALRGLLHSRPRPTVISLSWALSTLAAQSQGALKSTYQLFEDALREAMVLGITVCCASGDAGSSGEVGEHADALQVEYPAASRYVLACGGTTLRARSGRPVAETVWNARLAGIHMASGGGLAAARGATPEPPPWQSAALAHWAEHTSDRPRPSMTSVTRGVPDVACSADFNAGVALLVGGLDTRAGGTSASAPVWAALVARLNSALYPAVGTRLGYATPTFYEPSVAATFANIGTGNNSLARQGGYYRAVQGAWDPCTGLGTPRGDLLQAALRAAHAPPRTAKTPKTSRKGAPVRRRTKR